MVQQLKIWLLNATSVLVMQQQIFINKIHEWRVESYSQLLFQLLPSFIYSY